MTNAESLACLARMHDPSLEPYARYQARNELIEGNLDVATWAARRFKSPMPIDDRIQAARVALIQAVDTMQANSFTSGPWVPGVPRTTGQVKTYLEAAMYHALVAMAGKDRKGLFSSGSEVETRAKYGKFEAAHLALPPPDAALDRQARQERILATFATARPRLNRDEEDVLRVLYGLADGREMTTAETALALNLSVVRVRSRRDSAIKKIKSGLRGIAGQDAA